MLEYKIDNINKKLFPKIQDLLINNDYIKNQNNKVIELFHKLEILNITYSLGIIQNEYKQIINQYQNIEKLLKELKHLSTT